MLAIFLKTLPFFGVIVAGIGWRGFDVYMTNRARGRQEAIMMELPDVADQVAISVQAGLSFEQAIADLPPEYHGKRVEGSSHTLWRLLEHLRICQWDILEFSRDPEHESPSFPDGCWPDSDAPPSATAWEESVSAFQRDLESMVALVTDEKTDLAAEIPWGEGQTILREAMLVADHNAYHLGQFVFLRQCLGIWNRGSHRQLLSTNLSQTLP